MEEHAIDADKQENNTFLLTFIPLILKTLKYMPKYISERSEI